MKFISPFSSALIATLTVALASCGGGGADGTTPDPSADDTDGSDGTEPPLTSEAVDRPQWSELDRDARVALMTTQVMPRATELFQGFDPERYAVVNCATCHGAGAADGSFTMPNPAILPLHPSGSPEQQAMVQEHPQMVRFMFNHLVPAMRETMNVPPYEAETGDGFSCFYCHSHAEEAAPPAAEAK